MLSMFKIWHFLDRKNYVQSAKPALTLILNLSSETFKYHYNLQLDNMKVKLLLGTLLVLIIVISGCAEIPKETPSIKKEEPVDCVKEGESAAFTDPSTPNECCEGLKNVLVTDVISIADKCYDTGTETGTPFILCSDCGNGICEEWESVCGCSEDCIGKGRSTFNTIKDFCEDEYGYDHYCEICEEDPEFCEKFIPMCKLC